MLEPPLPARHVVRFCPALAAMPTHRCLHPIPLPPVGAGSMPAVPPPAPAGRVELAPGWDNSSSLPFLFDTDSMPTREAACPHCPKDENPLLCCGGCWG